MRIHQLLNIGAFRHAYATILCRLVSQHAEPAGRRWPRHPSTRASAPLTRRAPRWPQRASVRLVSGRASSTFALQLALALAPPLALALALAACGGREAAEDAPTLLGSGIPAAALNASGVQLVPSPSAPAFGTGTRRPMAAPNPEDVSPPDDPFGAIEPHGPSTPPPPVPPGTPPSKGTQL